MRSLITLFGFVAGIAATLAVLLNNPLQSAPLPVSDTNAYDWQALELHGASFGPSQLMNIPLGHRNQPFTADGIKTANAAVLILRDAAGQPAALAIRFEVLSDKSALFRADVGTSMYMNIIWPNYGSLFLHGYENRWPIIRDTVLKLANKNYYQPADSFGVSIAGSDRTVAGGSGGFAAIGGSFAEELYDDTDQTDRYAGRLELQLQTSGE